MKALDETKQKILNNYFNTDLEFHTEIHSLFSKLRDGHTQYSPPACYALFSFVLPFPLRSSLEQISVNGTKKLKQVIRIGKV